MEPAAGQGRGGVGAREGDSLRTPCQHSPVLTPSSCQQQHGQMDRQMDGLERQHEANQMPPCSWAACPLGPPSCPNGSMAGSPTRSPACIITGPAMLPCQEMERKRSGHSHVCCLFDCSVDFFRWRKALVEAWKCVGEAPRR